MIFEIYFTPLYCNGNLNLSVVINQQLCATWQHSDKCQEQQISFRSALSPTSAFQLQLVFDGKNQSQDTVLDDAGKIIHDKAIVIDQIKINDISVCHELFLVPFLTESGQIITKTNYFGFNGKFTIDCHPNLNEWLNQCKAQLQKPLQSYDAFLKEILL